MYCVQMLLLAIAVLSGLMPDSTLTKLQALYLQLALCNVNQEDDTSRSVEVLDGTVMT